MPVYRPASRADIAPPVEMLGRERVPVAPDAAHFDLLRGGVMDGLPMIFLGVVPLGLEALGGSGGEGADDGS